MNREYLLRHIAEVGYNVGFGAKKNFATYDMVSKVPGLIGLLSAAVGIFGLVFDSLSTKELSALIAVLGLVGYYVSQYEHKREKYSQAGSRLTEQYNELKKTYFRVKSKDDGECLEELEQRVDEIEKQANETGISEQIVLSDWYAHYKFYWQHQISWLDDELQFKLLRDKLPLSFTVSIFFAFLACCVWLAKNQDVF